MREMRWLEKMGSDKERDGGIWRKAQRDIEWL